MAAKKYPIGTKIKYIIGENSWHDFYGKAGEIVSIEQGYPVIYLPKSIHASKSCFSTVERPATIQCNWCEIELSTVKGQQLLFDFAK